MYTMYYLKTLLVTLIFARQSYGSIPLHQVPLKSKTILRFPSPSSKYYREIKDARNILLDLNNSKVIVASRDYIFQVSMTTLTLENPTTDITHFPVDTKAMEFCKLLDDWTPCYNYLLTLQLDPQKRIVTCGTNYRKPKCWTFQPKTLKLLQNLTTDAIGCPKSPNISVIHFYQDDYLFTATMNTERYYEITKTKPGGTGKVTTRMVKDGTKPDSPLRDPTFVSSYSLGDGFVYFFFREIANENQNTDRTVVYSRVARVCQYDVGEKWLYADTFITYLKSQLVCFQKGAMPVYFDELQSISVLHIHKNSTAETFIYGAFSTSTDLTGSSAICRYRFRDVKRVFQNSPYAEKEADGRWVKKPHPANFPDTGRPKCNSSMETNTYKTKAAGFTVTHPLLYDDILPYDGTAVIALGGIRFTSLAVDDIHFDKDKLDTGIHIIFTGTADGAIYKIMISSTNEGQPVILEKIQVFESLEPISTMKLGQNAVFATSPYSGVARVALQRCNRYILCSDCVASRDPYCAWSRKIKKCVPYDTIPPSDRVQNVTTGSDVTCPPGQRRITSGFSTTTYPYRHAMSSAVFGPSWLISLMYIFSSTSLIIILTNVYCLL